jgi:acyl-[acyl-carrier-protein]-phospholipid O-acyltransferase / long-chain-fatty-acid--[acyl-carrier-protein] ligase
MIRRLLHFLVRLLYGFKAYNLQSLSTGGPVLLLPNHVSWWDWIFIGVCLEDDWQFVTSSTTAELSWFHRRIMVNHRTFPVDVTSPYAVKRMAEYLQKGGRLVLFPEGRISTTGSLMKLFDGTGFLIFKTQAKVITAYIRGAHRLPFSRNPDRKKLFPTVSVHFSDVLRAPAIDQVSATEMRARVTDWLRDRMVRQQFETEMIFGPCTVPAAIRQAALESPGRVVLQDATLQELSYRRLLVGSDLLSTIWQRFGASGECVGVLLPNVNAMPLVLLSLWAAGKVPAVLNYTHGPAVLLSCARLAHLKRVVTSRAFLTRSGIDIEPLRIAGLEVIFLEDVRTSVPGWRRLAAALRAWFKLPLAALSSTAEDTAVILFTSGSEGEPKGVELTHRNLLANMRQMLAVIDLTDADRFFSALPLFHSFGLTVGLLLSLVRGTFVFLYLSPLHYRLVPSALYNLNCTVFFGTNTFLMGYARKAQPYDFRSLRYLFGGAEKIQESTSAVWMRKFGVRVLEGYGATECSPCISVNLPMRPRHGSAGQLLPGIEYRVERVEGVGDWEGMTADAGQRPEPEARARKSNFPAGGQRREQVGRLFVRGPNVMRGYLNGDANARFQALGGWYDTGDIARVDADGFIYILGRLKRFAKVSGEMVSLTAVEEALAGAFPQYGLRFAAAVVAQSDETKGEKLVVVTNEPKLDLAQVRDAIRGRGLGNLAVPREIRVLREVPQLGSGKIDHQQLQRIL